MARGIPKKNDWLPQARTPLCLLLNCTPNDLFDWREDGKTVVHDTHALRTLTKQTNDIQTHLRELPLDKLEKLGEMIAELKASNGVEGDR